MGRRRTDGEDRRKRPRRGGPYRGRFRAPPPSLRRPGGCSVMRLHVSPEGLVARDLRSDRVLGASTRVPEPGSGRAVSTSDAPPAAGSGPEPPPSGGSSPGRCGSRSRRRTRLPEARPTASATWG